MDSNPTMRLTLEIRNAATAMWHDHSVGPVHLGERAKVRVAVRTSVPSSAARFFVGDVLVASSLWDDRAEYHCRGIGYPPIEWECVGKLFRDGVGESELRVDLRIDDQWRRAPALGPIFVEPERLRPEEYAALCDAVAAESAELLFDIYGKTGFGAVRAGRGATGPAAVLMRVRATLDQLAAALSEIARQPAYRLKTRRVREPALPGQSISELTLEEACTDPTLAVVAAGRIRFREQVRETSALNYHLPENNLIADFLAFLRQQLADLRTGLLGETAWRKAQRPYRDRHAGDGKLSWWETEDKPRIDECLRMIARADVLESEANRLTRVPFLPPGTPLTWLPPSSPLVRSHRAYGSAYRVIAEHFAGHRLRMDDLHLVTKARSLPVLYEWWCALEVLRVLRGCLEPKSANGLGKRLESDRGRYVVEFAPDQSLDFADTEGRRIRCRYQPAYLPPGGGKRYGLLGRGTMRTPDLAVEIFPAGGGDLPELIVVFDAKYTSAPLPVKLDAVKLKYDRIGEFDSGRVLGRQVWALVPNRPVRTGVRQPDWATAAIADNYGVFSDQFDPAGAVCGVIQAVPLTGPGMAPVEGLLRHLFERCGVSVRG